MNWKLLQTIMDNNPPPPKRVEKMAEEWKRILTPEQFRVTRLHRTEPAFSGEYCGLFSPGIYTCVCCGTELFDSAVKFKSGTGWPSFTAPVTEDVVKYKLDNTYGVNEVEVLCNVCDAHLGHVYPDGPEPTGLRFCINSVSLKKEEGKVNDVLETATLGGGCFWCTEAVLEELEGVMEVTSGYAGGDAEDPGYLQISSGNTGHAEVVLAQFDPQKICYADLLRVFLATHNPTSLNRQEADVGSQYRSIIFYHNNSQQQTAREIIDEMQVCFDKPIVTEVVPFTKFFKADQSRQDYYSNNPEKAYCQTVINPKLQKLRAHFAEVLRKPATQL